MNSYNFSLIRFANHFTYFYGFKWGIKKFKVFNIYKKFYSSRNTQNLACFIVACVQNGTRRVYEGGHWLEGDQICGQSAIIGEYVFMENRPLGQGHKMSRTS